MSMTKGTPASSQIIWLEGRVAELEAKLAAVVTICENWNSRRSPLSEVREIVK